MNITDAIGQRSRAVAYIITVLLAVIAVACRYFVPPPFSVAFLFLLPVSFATWFLSWVAGAVIAAAGAVFLFYFDLKLPGAGHPVAYWNALINLVVGAVFIHIFSELRLLYHKQLNLSRHDALTGLMNRRAFVEAVTIETRRMSRHSRPLTIAYVDLDGFKQINDDFGHAAGDEFLISVADHIARRLRATDCLARLGGDEFAILLPETDRAAAEQVLTEIHKSLQDVRASREYQSTASVGAATFHSPEGAEKMIAVADEAMYAVKQSGKNKVQCKLVA